MFKLPSFLIISVRYTISYNSLKIKYSDVHMVIISQLIFCLFIQLSNHMNIQFFSFDFFNLIWFNVKCSSVFYHTCKTWFHSGESDKVPNSINFYHSFEKYLKKMMYNNVVNFMDKNDTFYKYQFGFTKNHSHTARYYNTCGQNYIILGLWRSYNRRVYRFLKSI